MKILKNSFRRNIIKASLGVAAIAGIRTFGVVAIDTRPDVLITAIAATPKLALIIFLLKDFLSIFIFSSS